MALLLFGTSCVFDTAAACPLSGCRFYRLTSPPGRPIRYPEAWDKDGGLWGDQWYNWGSSLAVLLPLQRMIGVDFNIVEGVSTAPGVFTVCDYIAPSWDRAEADVPVMTADGGSTWVRVLIERINSTAKSILVEGNPLGTLKLQPWLEGNKLVSAEPAGFSIDTPTGHIGWEFEGNAAMAASVTITW